MRLEELFLTQEDLESQRKEKLLKLKNAIEAGRKPEVRNAGGYAGAWAWGDLKAIGLAYKESFPAGRASQEQRWVYSSKAPGPITLIKRVNGEDTPVVFQPGDATDWIEVDYS